MKKSNKIFSVFCCICFDQIFAKTLIHFFTGEGGGDDSDADDEDDGCTL